MPLLKERGGGCIVFTGSDQALQPDAGLGPYAQAKAATHCFAKMLARELAQRGVPLARLGEPEEIAEAVLYLATASFCTGTILNISGGNVRAVLC